MEAFNLKRRRKIIKVEENRIGGGIQLKVEAFNLKVEGKSIGEGF